MCGEQVTWLQENFPTMGSSPRVRGAAEAEVEYPDHGGIIPACAGSSSLRNRSRRHIRDHPRVCGEQLHKIIHDTYFLGSSPRVRGAVDGAPRLRIVQGIIPARTGSSAQYICRACREGDHPRACGEQLPYQMRAATSLGSSPRVRGAGKPVGTSKNVHGIIPARAGSRAPR